MKNINKKSQAIPSGIVVLILLAFFIFVIVPEIKTQKGVHYQISLKDNQISQGSDTDLFFKITNELNKRVTISYIIYEIPGTNINGQIEYNKVLLPNEKIFDSKKLGLSRLDKEKYVIKTLLVYSIDGKPSKTELSLSIEIF